MEENDESLLDQAKKLYEKNIPWVEFYRIVFGGGSILYKGHKYFREAYSTQLYKDLMNLLISLARKQNAIYKTEVKEGDQVVRKKRGRPRKPRD